MQPAGGPSVTPGGFSDYERAALRVRNIGCGGVARGSGFAIADHVFVTNRHVIGGASVLQVSTYDGHDIDVVATGAVTFADLALVWTREALPQTIQLAAANPAIGASVTAIGYPLGGPLTTSHGKVLAYAKDPIGWSSLPMLMNDAPIEHGSSGSPLIDASGRLVGVVYAGGPSQFAVPVEVLKAALANPSATSHNANCDGVLGGPAS
ncbi:serine protease [Arthrobacter sp. YD4]|uniref:S1 family peptidase n=1 Tax=Arthrobacter sp. YD4 TaxID=3058043 RepID=UPI0025B4915B|nr:serine protease [Arthrobacter sp. YD4]MDN3934854.1 serine protease [Arthrobacter sp. YD4]